MAMSSELSSQPAFIVHPDYQRLAGLPVTAEVEEHEVSLQQTIGSSSLPILIYDPFAAGRGDFWNRFPAEQRFETHESSGYLRDEARIKFNYLLSERQVLQGGRAWQLFRVRDVCGCI